MIRYTFKRILLLIPVLLGVTFIIFVLLSVAPGDPTRVILGEGATQENVDALREQMGLDDPLIIRAGRFIVGFVTKGDLGRSYTTKEPVRDLISQRFPNTVKLAICSVLVSVTFGLLFGIISAVKPYSAIDNVSMSLALVGVSMPRFWQGLLCILLFSVKLSWLPSSGLSSFRHMILPAFTVGISSMAELARMTRSSMLEVIGQDYITSARAKGLKEYVVIIRHALKNALIPIITIVGLNFGTLLGGAVVVESIFSIPGVGKLMLDAIKARNYPVIQGGVLYIAFAFCIVNLIVDILYTFVDPRVKSKYS